MIDSSQTDFGRAPLILASRVSQLALAQTQQVRRALGNRLVVADVDARLELALRGRRGLVRWLLDARIAHLGQMRGHQQPRARRRS